MGRFLIVFILALLSSIEASANPLWSEMLRGSPADGPHVRLVYLVVKTTSDSAAPVLTCHGASCSPWQEDSDTSENTGSGVKALRAMHMCDCHVPTETELKYIPENKPSYFTTINVTVPASYQRDPEPGASCQAECELADTQAAGKAGHDDAAPPAATGGAPAGGDETAPGGGDCTFAPVPRHTALPLLVLALGLIVFGRRRS